MGTGKKPNKFVTFLWMVLFGIVFGVCAGVTFTGISLVSNKVILPNVLQSANRIEITSEADPVKPEIDDEDAHAQIEEQEEILDEVEDIVMSNEEYTVAEVAEACMPSIVMINVIGTYEYNGYKAEGSVERLAHIMATGEALTMSFVVLQRNRPIPSMPEGACLWHSGTERDLALDRCARAEHHLRGEGWGVWKVRSVK